MKSQYIRQFFVGLSALILFGCTPDSLSSGQSNSIHRQPPGTILSGRVQVGRAVLDLPDGLWTIVSAAERRASSAGVESTVDAQVMLMRFSDGTGDRILGTMTIVTNVSPARIYWLRNPECTNQTRLHVVDNFRSDSEHYCWTVSAFRPNWRFENALPYELDGVRFAANKVNLVPISFIGTRHWIAKDGYRLSLTHFTAVSTLGVTSNTSDDWIEASRMRSPQRQQVFAKWLEYSAERQQHYIDGFSGRLAIARPAGPVVISPSSPVPASTPATGPADRATRLRELMDLREKNLITESEFQSRRSRILEGL